MKKVLTICLVMCISFVLIACAKDSQYSLKIEKEGTDLQSSFRVSLCDVIGNGKYDAGAIVTIEVEFVHDDLIFIGWYYGETLLSSEIIYDYTMPAKNVKIRAVFAPKL